MSSRPRRRRSPRYVGTPTHLDRMRINERFLRDETGPYVTPAEAAWLLVAEAVQRAVAREADPYGRPDPDADDALAALSQKPEVLEVDEIRELRIIAYADSLPEPQRPSWRAIGVALGYPPDNAKQAAYDRFHTLAKRYPDALIGRHRKADDCGATLRCTCDTEAAVRSDAGCDTCPHCTPVPRR